MSTPAASHRPVRFPISAKILLWFFVNIAFLAAVGFFFARAQLRVGLDSLLAGPVNDRLQTMAEVLTTHLKEKGSHDWATVLRTTGAAYHVKLGLFRNDGRVIAGDLGELPPEVRNRLTEVHDQQRPRPPGQDGRELRDGQDVRDRPLDAPRDGDRPRGDRPPRDGLRNGPPGQRPGPPPAGEGARPDDPDPRGDRDGPPDERGRARDPFPPARDGGYPKSLIRSHDPALYWVIIRLPLMERQMRPPNPVALLLSTDSLEGGGLLFDLGPWLWGGVAVLAISVLLWVPLVVGITRALRQMTSAAETIAQGRFETQVETNRADELGRLGGALNHMAGRLREFFTGQKRFLGDIAHELCSPLARMEMALGVLEQRADEKQLAYVTDVRDEVRQMSALVNELLSFSKAGVGGQSLELKPVMLAPLAARAVTRESKERGGIVVDVPVSAVALAEPELLGRALGNVLRNALRYAAPAMAGGEEYSYRPAVHEEGGGSGPITVSTREDGSHLILSVTDSGPGVPEDALHRLFDPFFRPESARTRETGGAGLGLAIVKSCVEACGGTVAVRNIKPHGLQVDFRLKRG